MVNPPDPQLIQYIVKAAHQYGADPNVLLATALQESGGHKGAVGDQGTSFGYYQFHKGGALPQQYYNNPFPYADSYNVVANRAQQFSKYNVHGGTGAAAIQRPANQTAYASSVDGLIPRARQILSGKVPVPNVPQHTAVTQQAQAPVVQPQQQVQQQQAPQHFQMNPQQPANLQPGGDPLQQSRTALLGYLMSQNQAYASGQQGQNNIVPILAQMMQSNQAPQGLMQFPQSQSRQPSVAPTMQQGTSMPAEAPVTLPKGQKPSPHKEVAKTAVEAAKGVLGTPYSWGGGSPSGPTKGIAQGAGTVGFDCSALLQYGYAKQGISIPRTTYDQWKTGRAVDRKGLEAGDAVFFHPGPKGPEHVGIYMGNGKFIEAPHTGATVRISNLEGRSDYMGARRYG